MSLSIEVPATLANLGSGYDALGLAIDVSNVFRITPGANGPVDLVRQTALAAAARFGGSVPPFRVDQDERVPRSRGMGSSATARVAGLLAHHALTGIEPDRSAQLAFLAEAEGHPDNAWPALLGGLVICGGTMKRLVPHTSLSIAVCVPSVEVSTPAARAALPATVPHSAAVANVGAVALLVAGLLDGDLSAIRAGVQDALHQPWRAPLIGPVDSSFAAAEALGGAPFVSGSGSTLAAFVGPEGDALAVAHAMTGPFQDRGIVAEARVVRPRDTGATVAERPSDPA